MIKKEVFSIIPISLIYIMSYIDTRFFYSRNIFKDIFGLGDDDDDDEDKRKR